MLTAFKIPLVSASYRGSSTRKRIRSSDTALVVHGMEVMLLSCCGLLTGLGYCCICLEAL
jgi:hypothetical protein